MSKKVIKEVFDTYSGLLDTLNSRPNNQIMQNKHASHDTGRNSKEFTGLDNYTQAEKMLTTGYLDVLSKLEKSVENQQKISAKFTENIKRPRPKNSVMGYVPNVPAALLNLPEAMVNTTRVPQKRKTLSVLYSIGGNCDRDTDYFINAGTALLSAIDIVERSGITTRLEVGFFTAKYNNEYTFPTLKIKDYNERYSLQKISFPLVHPSMFRRIGFKWLESTPDIKETGFNFAYGSTPSLDSLTEAVKPPQNTYLLDAGWICDVANNDVGRILQKFEVI